MGFERTKRVISWLGGALKSVFGGKAAPDKQAASVKSFGPEEFLRDAPDETRGLELRLAVVDNPLFFKILFAIKNKGITDESRQHEIQREIENTLKNFRIGSPRISHSRNYDSGESKLVSARFTVYKAELAGLEEDISQNFAARLEQGLESWAKSNGINFVPFRPQSETQRPEPPSPSGA